MTYRLTPRARHGLRGIILYVEHRFGPDVARVLARMVAAFEQLTAHPESGHLRQDLTDSAEIRFWSVGPTLIAYRVAEDGAAILLVERGEVDWERLLQESARES